MSGWDYQLWAGHMMLHRRAFLASLAGVPLAGCGIGSELQANFAEPASLASGSVAAAPTIGVISAIGDTFEFRTVGMTVFGNDLQKAPLTALNIDSFVTSTIAARLGSAASVRPIVMPPGTFDAYHNPPGMLSGAPDADKSGNDRLSEILARAAIQTKAERYLVVTKGSSNFGQSNIRLNGIGLVIGPELLMASRFLHCLLDLRLHDGRTFAPINVKFAKNEPPAFLPVIHGPHIPADPSWPSTAPELVADQRIAAAIKSLVERSITTTLPQVVSLGKVR